MKIATAAYPLTPHQTWAAYAQKLTDWVTEATNAGAHLLVFPEYGAMELAAISGQAGDLELSLHAVSELIPQADELHAALAQEYGVFILAASAPVFDATLHPTRPVNRARFFTPTGCVMSHDKQIMTRFEREVWDVVPGGPLTVIETAIGRIGVLICYDSEFPLLGRALIEAGAEILLVPSCTDAMTGYHRVRTGAVARALEGQCITVQSPTVGDCDWCPAVDENRGAAGVFGPSDIGFPAGGVVALGGTNKPGWVYADIDLGRIHDVRTHGAVRGVDHWPEQEPSVKSVTKVDLR